jgi:hypothetical protein
MQPPYKHLDETTMAEDKPGIWVPAIPIPQTKLSMFFKTEFICGCGQRFSSHAMYCFHYRTEQLLEMNAAFAKRIVLTSAKARYWRRAAFVYQYGSEREIEQLNALGTPEFKNVAQINYLNGKVEELWDPIYESIHKLKDMTVGQIIDSMEVEDETPEQAKADFAEPYTHVNSFGVTYYLNMKSVALRGGKNMNIYFFSKEFKPEFAQRSLPDDKRVSENPRNGFLCVVKK